MSERVEAANDVLKKMKDLESHWFSYGPSVLWDYLRIYVQEMADQSPHSGAIVSFHGKEHLKEHLNEN